MRTSDLFPALNALDFTAIDVETANEQYDSLCAIGIATVRKGIITNNIAYLIRPRDLRVSVINQQIHKITESDLLDQSELGEIWQNIEPLLVNQVLVAHNAAFDIEVLRQSLSSYGLAFPKAKYLCSLKLAAQAFPGLPSYRLKDLAATFDLPLIHHDAASDANVCATITTKSIPRVDLTKLSWKSDELTDCLETVPSFDKPDPWTKLFGTKSFDSRLLKPNLDVENKDNPFYNKRVVFTGDLDGMERAVAAQLIQAMGADINTSISKRTHIVILGRAPGPSKMRKIEQLRSEGHSVRLMYENEFLKLVAGG